MPKSRYDVVIVGSGLGGMVAAVILAKEGKKVCLLEKNKQYGGNLQTFVRNRVIFDTGVHYLGGLAPNQNLYRYFKYLGIMDDLRLQPMAEDGFDRVSFGDKEYGIAQGYERFTEVLSQAFPNEGPALEAYCKLLKDTCGSFPLYNLEDGAYSPEAMAGAASTVIESLTNNPTLQAVLGATNFLYAGIKHKTPFYVHALAVNSYIQSAWRCENGGSQIAKLLLRELRKHGGEAYRAREVVKFIVKDDRVSGVLLNDRSPIAGNTFIANMDVKRMISLVGATHFRKAYTNRIGGLEDGISAFSLYIVFKPGTFPYADCNHYHFNTPDEVWSAQDYTPADWPRGFMCSFTLSKNQGRWAEGMTCLAYMKYEEVAPWAKTFHTTLQANGRGTDYETFKAEKAARLLAAVERKFPGIGACIQNIYSSTPLSYRDYMGASGGNMYGYVKDAADPMRTAISVKTKLPNLFLAGQCVGMHGITGVTIGAVLTCKEILGDQVDLVGKIVGETEAFT